MAGRLVDYTGSGLAAGLPSAAGIDAVLTTGAGAIYYATDTSTFYVLDRVAVAWDTVGGGGGATNDMLNRSVVFSGRYYAPDTLDFQSGGTSTLASNELFLLPFSSKVDFDRLAVHFTAVGAGTSSYRLGVYDSDPDDGLPTTLVLDSGAIVAATTGLKNYDIGSTITPTAPLWLAYIQDAGLTLVTGALATPRSQIIGNTSLNAAAPSSTGVSYAMAFGALPTDLTGLTATRTILGMVTAAKI